MIVRVLIAVLAVLVLALVVASLAVLRDREAARRRVAALFRRPEKVRPLDGDHYYRPYWS